MQFAVYGKMLAPESVPYLVSLIDKLDKSGCGILFYEPFFRVLKDHITPPAHFGLFYHNDDLHSAADILLSIGGDGTMLDTITLVRDSGIPILGVNMGKLGFLSSLPKDDIIAGIDRILQKNYTLDRRTLLRLESENKPFGDLNFAMNEFTVSKKGNMTMITVHTYIDEKFLNSYWGDGLIVSTPTGSTAYSLSCGGPIISPGSETFVITPVATHNLTVRPMVIPDHSRIRIRVEGRNDLFNISLDSRSVGIQGTSEFTICKEDFTINLIQMEGQDFIRTIRAKLNWGVDIRN
ncbi:MAG: NAD kinase [Bacteroidetes bacterium]|nr:NAD kinase [Bacteroidota bacterium]